MQTLVTFAVVTTATVAAILGITLLTSANEAAQNARAASHGADISVTVNEARATRAELTATKSVPGVRQVAGPYPEAAVTLRYAAASSAPRGGPGGRPGGGPVGPSGLGGRRRGAAGPGSRSGPGSAKPGSSQPPRLVIVPPTPPGASGSAGGSVSSQRTIIGRSSRGGPLDDLSVDPGHWLTGPGQIVLPPYEGAPPIGSTVTVVSAPGKPRLTVVGYGGSSGRFGDGWVLRGELAALRPAGAPARAQMLYTFARASNIRQIIADVAALRAALPAGAIVSYQSWLDAIGQTSGESSFNTPFVLAFALLAVVLAILIVASLVSGAVVAGYRRIGVLKSIGFTPLQVGAAYVGQAGVPAVAGIVAGVVVGNLWATPILSGPRAGLFGPGSQHVPAWIDVAVPAAVGLLVTLAALVPALRAGGSRPSRPSRPGRHPERPAVTRRTGWRPGWLCPARSRSGWPPPSAGRPAPP